MKKIIILLLLLVTIFGCISNKKTSVPVIMPVEASKKLDKFEWRQYEQAQQPAIQIDYKFAQIYLKEIITLLMDLTGENYIIVDELQGSVENVEISGKYNREEIINIIAVITNSKGYKIQKSDETYIFSRNVVDEEKDQVAAQILRELPKKNTYIYKLQYESSGNIKQIVNLLYDAIKVDEMPSMNMLIINSEMKDYEDISQLIKKLDVKPKQVLVEMMLLDVTLNNALKFGVEYFFRNNKTSFGNLSLLPDGMNTGTAPLIGSGLKAISLSHQLDSIINLIRTETEVEIISKPKILVQDGKTSLIKIGRSEPIRRGTSIGSNNQTSENIDYRDTGIILSVTTKVNESNIVRLDINQEVSDIIKSAENPLINSPSFTTKNINITTLLKDGQSIYIGGLMENSESKLQKKVPLLGSIPYLGRLFSSTDIIKKKTELVLLVSVEILTTEKDFENVKLRFVK